MKRTVLAAVMVVALMFGIVAFAVALDDTGDVVVTAKVNPAFSMEISEPAIDFTGLDVGDTDTGSSVITVKSNKLWDFTKSDDVVAPLAAVLTETSMADTTDIARGVTTIDAEYAIDLSTDAAYDLEADTNYVATYTYTAVQQ
ncbi:MAG: hypothetical protein Q7W44_05695 [Coriobacteriia bacterium]|nr:hypothetical protein [Coriobacteriia bacterium]